MRSSGVRAWAVALVALAALLGGAGCSTIFGIEQLSADEEPGEDAGQPDGADGEPGTETGADADSDTGADSSVDTDADSSVDADVGVADVAVEDALVVDVLADTPADPDAGTPGLGALGTACSGVGTLACNGHGQKLTLVCGADGRWAANVTCGAGQLCDSRPGLDQGTCAAVVPLCATSQPNAFVCDGQQRVQCGPDLVSSSVVATCTDQACVGGACTGVCAPNTKQCASSSTTQTCDASGQWAAATACPGGACNGAGLCGQCAQNALQCGGTGNQQPQKCDAGGTWQSNGGACSSQACVAGACQGVCAPDALRCSGQQPQNCDANGTWQNSGTACGSGQTCSAGACITTTGTSCQVSGQGLTNCGPSGDEDCCTSLPVTGGTFYRSSGGVSYPATVSSFRLDKYEITVGRFRQFVAAWEGGWRPAQGAGKHAWLNAGSGLANSGSGGGYEIGWDATWASNLATTNATWSDTSHLSCNSTSQTWTPSAGSNENRPINCMSWYEAYAFCIWDGGVLPSDAEWNYAAAGGSEQRAYPWSSPANSTIINCSYANYDSGSYCSASYTNDVGSESPKGDGAFGHSDLGGNVWEWNLDWSSPYSASCSNCAQLTNAGSRVIRGGSFGSVAPDLLASYRNSVGPSDHSDNVGARCLRTP